MYEAAGIVVTLGGARILDGVDLSLAPGTVTALIGPNGAGKSTLLRVLAGEVRPQAGHVTLHGTDVRQQRAAELARLRAVLPQAVHLAFPFTVDEVIGLGISPATPAPQALDLVDRAREAVGLVALGKRACTSLSGGEQQRAHLARVLVQLWSAPEDGRARYLLLDEPTASLDLAHQLLVLRLARAHAEAGGGVLAVLHDLNLTAMIADEVVALHSGRVVAEGRPADVITDRLLAEVYGVAIGVGTVPDSVFVLPQAAGLNN